MKPCGFTPNTGPSELQTAAVAPASVVAAFLFLQSGDFLRMFEEKCGTLKNTD